MPAQNQLTPLPLTGGASTGANRMSGGGGAGAGRPSRPFPEAQAEALMAFVAANAALKIDQVGMTGSRSSEMGVRRGHLK